MIPARSPFPAVWWSVDLPGYRPCDATDCAFAYETLPPLDDTLFRGEWQWLGPMDAELQERLSIYRRPEVEERMKGNLNRVKTAAAQMGLRLPDSFITFMASPERQAQIPSSTACYFDLSDHILQLPFDDGGFLIRFLNDQQEILLWYLYLTRSGDHCVLVSPILLDEEDLDNIPPESLRANINYCGSSFEEFLYRFWLENDIWFAIEENRPLSEAQAAYLRHYK